MGTLNFVRKDQSGMTLVELMVSAGLFGVVSLTAAQAMVYYTRSTVSAQNESAVNSGISEFMNAFEVYISNATRIESCRCGGTADTTCAVVNSGSGTRHDMLADATSNTAQSELELFTFETEDMTDPTQVTTTGCLYGSDAATIESSATDGMIPRGCKRKLEIVFKTPTIINSSTREVGSPGELVIRDITSGSTDLHTLKGVYSVICGMPIESTGQTPSPTQFHIELLLKARTNNLNKANSTTELATLESWHPSDTNGRFRAGIHRLISSTVPLLNMNSPGIHYGKPSTFTNCGADDAASSDGNCCSGYWNGTTCVAAASCTVTGGTPVVSSSDIAFAACCSHLAWEDGTCL